MGSVSDKLKLLSMNMLAMATDSSDKEASCNDDPEPSHNLQTSVTNTSKNKWRTGNRLKDELYLYEGSFFYDCTFEVNNSDDPSKSKIFKCHKMVLALASPVFESMLFGHFQEAAKTRDDPIKLDDVHPDIFDLSMKYIYGGKTGSWRIYQVPALYKLADKWQFDHLKEFIISHLKGNAGWFEAFYALHIIGPSKCCEELKIVLMEKIQGSLEEIFKTVIWIVAKEETVLEILKQESLDIKSEVQLFDALIVWGRAQIKGTDVTLRAKIDPGLRLIRFRTMQSTEFAKCARDEILTCEEKLGILMSIDLCDADYYPKNFDASRKLRRLLFCNKLNFGFEEYGVENVVFNSTNVDGSPSSMYFSVFRSDLIISGVKLSSLNSSNKGKTFSLSCDLLNDKLQVVARADFDGVNDFDENSVLYFTNEVALSPRTYYTICVTYRTNDQDIELMKFAILDRYLFCDLQPKPLTLLLGKAHHLDILSLCLHTKEIQADDE